MLRELLYMASYLPLQVRSSKALVSGLAIFAQEILEVLQFPATLSSGL